MSLTVKRFITSVCLCGALLHTFVTPTLASGAVTNTASGPGQVQISTESGAMQLTTSTNPGEATESARTTIGFFGDIITVPKGFAQDIGTLLNAVLSLIMVIASLLLFLYLILGAFKWITSGGDKGKTDQARQMIIAAVVGIIIVASSYAILLLALQFLGFKDLKDVFDNTKTIS